MTFRNVAPNYTQSDNVAQKPHISIFKGNQRQSCIWPATAENSWEGVGEIYI